MTYEVKEFDLPDLKGLSSKQVEVHLGLYAGYVKHVNLCRELIADLSKDSGKNAFAITELRRRFSFEFDGMRMHEYYFEGFSAKGGPASGWEIGDIGDDSKLKKVVSEKYGDWNKFIEHLTQVGLSRGIGWAVLYFDPRGNTPHVAWISDHELGTLAGLPIILAMDMWEHAFMVDYLPAEKKDYISACLANTNWSVAEERFKNAK